MNKKIEILPDREKWYTQQEKITIAVIDNDAKGENGGTEYLVTHTFCFKITDTKEDFLKKVLVPYSTVHSQLKG